MNRILLILVLLLSLTCGALATLWIGAAREASALRITIAAQQEALDARRTIARAVDGDTLELDGGERVRLLGIDTPETVRKEGRKWVVIENPKYGARESYEYMRTLEGKRVRLSYDKSREDRYGRTLAYVYVLPDGPDLSEEMLRRGWARLMLIPPNYARRAELEAAAAEGKAQAN